MDRVGFAPTPGSTAPPDPRDVATGFDLAHRHARFLRTVIDADAERSAEELFFALAGRRT
jgi:hypothetical protein